APIRFCGRLIGNGWKIVRNSAENLAFSLGLIGLRLRSAYLIFFSPFMSCPVLSFRDETRFIWRFSMRFVGRRGSVSPPVSKPLSVSVTLALKRLLPLEGTHRLFG